MSRKLPDSMHWQTYQACLQGPHALFRLFEAAFGRRSLCGEPDPDRQQREIKAMSEHITRLKTQIEKAGHRGETLRMSARPDRVDKYYTQCRHVLCGVHLLRELTYFEELSAETKAWAATLKELLLKMKREVEQVREESEKHLA